MGHALRPKIAVVGGGYSGMAAAVTIAGRGAIPVVFEAARTLGGRARRVDYREHKLDNGQHILSGAYSELLRLMNVVGVGARTLQRVPLSLQMPPDFALRAPLLPAPLHTAFALLSAKGLSWGDRMSAIRLMRGLQSKQWRVEPDIAVTELLSGYRQSQRLIEFLWQPLTVSALNTPIQRASAQVFANVLRDALAGEREASDLLLPTVDLSALFPEPAAAWLAGKGGEVRTGVRVDQINYQENGVTLVHGESADAFDATVLAVAPQQLGAFSGIFAPKAAPVLEFEPISTVYLGYAGASGIRLDPTMVGQARGLVHWFFDRRELHAEKTAATADELVVAGVVSASRDAVAMGADALIAQSHTELTRFLPALASRSGPDWSKLITEKFATFSCTPGLVRPTLHTSSPRICLAGDFVDNPYPATLEGAVRNGIAAAHAACDAATRLNATP